MCGVSSVGKRCKARHARGAPTVLSTCPPRTGLLSAVLNWVQSCDLLPSAFQKQGMARTGDGSWVALLLWCTWYHGHSSDLCHLKNAVQLEEITDPEI